MRVAEVERRSGLSRDTLRFYEREGLITPPRRDGANYRVYDPHTLVELNFIRRAQAIGFSLDEIRQAIPRLRDPSAPCPQLLAALQRKRTEIEQRLSEERQRLERVDAMLARLFGRSE